MATNISNNSLSKSVATFDINLVTNICLTTNYNTKHEHIRFIWLNCVGYFSKLIACDDKIGNIYLVEVEYT
ncbi:hypothetical protein YC2023_053414 [Brassica napus]